MAEHCEGGAEAAGEAIGEGSTWGCRTGGGQSGRKLSPGAGAYIPSAGLSSSPSWEPSPSPRR